MSLTIEQLRRIQDHLRGQKEQLIELAPATRWAYGPDASLLDGDAPPPPPRPVTADHGYLVVKATKSRTRHQGRWYASDVNDGQAWHEVVTDEATGKRLYWYRSIAAYAGEAGLLT